MKTKLLALAVSSVLAGYAATAAAQPFNSFDPRSMAMGGTGVAVSSAANAPFFNPALLATTEASDDFAIELPIVGVRASDPEDLLTSVQDVQDEDLVNALDDAIDAPVKDYNQIAALADQLASDPEVGLPAVSEKLVHGELGAATVISIPSKKMGTAFVMNTWAAFGGIAHYRDQAVLEELISDANSCATVTTPACVADVSNFNPTTDLQSSVDIRGIALMELGLSLAREYEIFGTPLAIGITPKYVRATTFDYTADVNDAETSDINGEDFMNEQSNFNLDIGIARDFQNGWRTGLVVKNLIPQEYECKQNGVINDTHIEINPQARASVSYQNNWGLAALDVDLTENDAVGFEDNTRYVALGGELNAWDWAQLRAGYRINTVNSDDNVASVGIGLSPWGVHIDLGVAANDHEIGVATQFGFRF